MLLPRKNRSEQHSDHTAPTTVGQEVASTLEPTPNAPRRCQYFLQKTLNTQLAWLSAYDPLGSRRLFQGALDALRAPAGHLQDAEFCLVLIFYKSEDLDVNTHSVCKTSATIYGSGPQGISEDRRALNRQSGICERSRFLIQCVCPTLCIKNASASETSR